MRRTYHLLKMIPVTWISVTDLIIILDLIVLVVALYLLMPMLFGAAYYPSSRDLKDLLREVLQKHFRDRSTVKIIDLGSGFGRVCFWACEIDPRVVCRGVDIDPIKVLWSNFMSRLKGLEKRASFKRGNIFNEDLGEYDLIYMFLWSSTVEKLERKILREAKKGSVVISLEHPLKVLKASKWKKYYIAYVE